MKNIFNKYKYDLSKSKISKELFEKYFTQMFYFALKILKDEAISKDIVMDSFVYIIEKKCKFKTLPEFRAYLYYCVKNKSLNYIRDYQNKTDVSSIMRVPSKDMPIDEFIIEQELKDRILEEINKLGGVKREVMLLRLKDKSYPEISKALSLSINTVKTHKKQAYKELRINLSDMRKSK